MCPTTGKDKRMGGGGDKTGHELETAENLKWFDEDIAAIHGATQEADDYVTF